MWNVGVQISGNIAGKRLDAIIIKYQLWDDDFEGVKKDAWENVCTDWENFLCSEKKYCVRNKLYRAPYFKAQNTTCCMGSSFYIVIFAYFF